MRDLILAIRADEAKHSTVNHTLSLIDQARPRRAHAPCARRAAMNLWVSAGAPAAAQLQLLERGRWRGQVRGADAPFQPHRCPHQPHRTRPTPSAPAPRTWRELSRSLAAPIAVRQPGPQLATYSCAGATYSQDAPLAEPAVGSMHKVLAANGLDLAAHSFGGLRLPQHSADTTRAHPPCEALQPGRCSPAVGPQLDSLAFATTPLQKFVTHRLAALVRRGPLLCLPPARRTRFFALRQRPVD
jgi:hypothetical protein